MQPVDIKRQFQLRAHFTYKLHVCPSFKQSLFNYLIFLIPNKNPKINSHLPLFNDMYSI